MKTPEEQRAEVEALARHRVRVVAETQRQFEANRETNLARKIAHLRSHGMKRQADLLADELIEWKKVSD